MAGLNGLRQTVREASTATLLGLIPHYFYYYVTAAPLWTETLARWIMARTPSGPALWMLDHMGSWAKPFALTGALAMLGFCVWLLHAATRKLAIRWALWPGAALLALALGWYFDYFSWQGQLLFWLPATAILWINQRPPKTPQPSASLPARRAILRAAPAVMSGGVLFVALEGYARARLAAGKANTPVALYRYSLPQERATFGAGLVRPSITPIEPVDTFYVMSHGTVDPSLDPANWKLRIEMNDRLLREVNYAEILSLPRREQFVTLRCVSNTLKSNLMGTASWSGVSLSQLADLGKLPRDIVEAAFIGDDGHGDSFPLPYAFSDEPLLALGMNGKTLNRAHGFPLRLLAPRYYGFKSVKWLTTIRFVSQPYFGTWPKTGFTKEPVLHTASSIDRIQSDGGGLRVGGVSFAGIRGVKSVQIRANSGEWIDATLETPLSPYTWTRWIAKLPAAAKQGELEARALDGEGHWQETWEGPLYPNGRTGPTVRRYSL